MKEAPAPLWNFISLEQFSKPAEPVSETARSWVKALWEKVPRSPSPKGPVNVQVELRSIPQDLLDSIAPVPNWDEAKKALDSAVRMWLDSGQSEQFLQVVIGPPGSGTSHILNDWAKEQHCNAVEPPTSSQILEGAGDWLALLAGNAEVPLVIPCLERFYLRHHNGLGLLRKLLDWLVDSRRQCLIGCNSWAWAYLSESLQINSVLPFPLVLEAFDGLRLQTWFRRLAMSSGTRLLIFRQADDGCFVLPVDESAEGYAHQIQIDESCERRGDEGEDISDFLKRLAARSRGIPLVAWAIWRHSVNVAIDKEIGEEAQKAAVADGGETIWVRPWSQIQLPGMPSGISQTELFLLHTILLHDGLPAHIIPHLLPFPPTEIRQKLHRLSAAGLLKEEEGIWRVTLLGYPAVRQHLNNEDYLVDSF